MIKKYLKQLYKIPVKIHNITWFFFLFMWLAFGTQYLIILLSALFFIFLHEHGHIFVASKYGISTHRIVITPLGGVAEMNSGGTNKQNLWISIAGPLVNLILAFLFFILYSISYVFFYNLIEIRYILSYAILLNGVLCIFNLLPAKPMDGGNTLESILILLKVKYTIRNMVIAYSAKIISVMMILFGIYSFNIILILIGVFIYFNYDRV